MNKDADVARAPVQPTGRESPFHEDEIIVSKTDLKGRLTYTNDVFLRVSGFSAKEIIGQPHSIIRHPDMPRAVFKLFWDYLQRGKEIVAYVKNMAADGSYYWVCAMAAPTKGGFLSIRLKPTTELLRVVEGVYKQMLNIESSKFRLNV